MTPFLIMCDSALALSLSPPPLPAPLSCLYDQDKFECSILCVAMGLRTVE